MSEDKETYRTQEPDVWVCRHCARVLGRLQAGRLVLNMDHVDGVSLAIEAHEREVRGELLTAEVHCVCGAHYGFFIRLGIHICVTRFEDVSKLPCN